MTFSFSRLIWPHTWSKTHKILYTPCTYTVYRCCRNFHTHTQNKFEIFLNKKYMCSANSQVIPVIGKAGKRFVIKLHPCLSVGTFKPQRFSPKKNNVRQNWFNGEEGMAEDGSGRLKALFLRNKVILISTCNYCQLIKISKVMQSPVLCNSQTDLIFLISNSRQL